MSNENDTRELIIIGGGPAGYTAALYAARANLQPLVIEGFAWGGQLMITSDVENYPGYPDGIMGPQMMHDFRRQAERFGAEFVTDDVTRVDFTEHPFRVYVGETEHRSEAVIVATGASARQLGLESERTLQGKGVSYCAVCDAAFFRDREVVVVGGGDSAMEEAIFLTKFANKVTLIHRRPEFRASPIMIDRARANDKIEFLTPAVVEEVVADNGQTSALRVRHIDTDELQEISAHGLFVAIGHDPNTKLFLEQLDHDEAGYLVTEAGSTRTNIEGVFAAGDVVDHTYRQAVTAAGSGTMAALDAERWLAAREGPGHGRRPDGLSARRPDRRVLPRPRRRDRRRDRRARGRDRALAGHADPHAYLDPAARPAARAPHDLAHARRDPPCRRPPHRHRRRAGRRAASPRPPARLRGRLRQAAARDGRARSLARPALQRARLPPGQDRERPERGHQRADGDRH